MGMRSSLVYPMFRRVEFPGKRRLYRVLAPPAEGQVEITVGGVRLRLDLAETMQRDIFYGLCDSFELRILKRFLRTGGDFVDVGAHIGLYSVTLADMLTGAGRVLAFEPNDLSATRLTKNLELNQCDNVIVVRGAASETAGVGTLRVPTGADASWSSLVAEGFDHELATVELTRIDDEVRAYSLRPRAVKIDVEGHERSVLAGMIATLESRPAILCEVNGATSASEIQQNLAARDYLSFRVFPRGLTPLRGQNGPGLFNALFVPRERLAELGTYARRRPW